MLTSTASYLVYSPVLMYSPSPREYLLVDPTHQEERVMDGRLVVAMNVHREICALQMAGGVAILPEQVKRQG